MTICNECGVELEVDMSICPLCDTPVGEKKGVTRRLEKAHKPAVSHRHLLRQILWQITSVLLLSGIAATLIINLSIHGKITWSVYPITICLIIFSYASLVSFWHKRIVFQIWAGWMISAIVLYIVGLYVNADWPIKLALPLLCAINVIGLLVNFILRISKAKGLNIIAIIFVAIALLCLVIEGIISFYFTASFKLQWSVIVSACLIPVTAAIAFMYFRTRNNIDIQKIFHT
jgi:hypothetical protein